MWSVLAAAVVATHAAYLIYQMCGGLLGLRDRRWLWPHIAAVTWGVLIVAVQGNCPVTRLEKWLHVQAGDPPYSGSFLDHYVFGRYLPDGSQPWVYGLHLVVIVLCYVLVGRAWMGARGGDLVAAPEKDAARS